jgi:phage/plasmid-associated DNA primase
VAWGQAEGAAGAADVIVFQNGLVDITTGEMKGLTPRFWAQSAVGCEYDQEARCSRWEGFLGD